jgi:regulation of enolase protein 1 (concanavalin A-like superfamily)
VLKDQHWGDSEDPDGDCKFLLDVSKLRIKIPGTPHRLGVEAGGMNAPRVVRTVEGDFQAEVKVLGPFPSAPRSLVGKYPWYGAGLLVWQDEKNYIRLERARMDFAPNNQQCYVNWELRKGGEPARKGSGKDGMIDQAQPAFLRLVRAGNDFTAAYSQDGKDWSELPLLKTDFGKKLKVGVAAMQNTAAGYDATFESLTLTPGKK